MNTSRLWQWSWHSSCHSLCFCDTYAASACLDQFFWNVNKCDAPFISVYASMRLCVSVSFSIGTIPVCIYLDYGYITRVLSWIQRSLKHFRTELRACQARSYYAIVPWFVIEHEVFQITTSQGEGTQLLEWVELDRRIVARIVSVLHTRSMRSMPHWPELIKLFFVTNLCMSEFGTVFIVFHIQVLPKQNFMRSIRYQGFSRSNDP